LCWFSFPATPPKKTSTKGKCLQQRYETLHILNFLTFTAPFKKFRQYAVADNGTSYDIAPGARLGFGFAKITGGDAIGIPIPVLIGVAFGTLQIPTDNLPHANFVPTISSAAYTFPNSEGFSIYKNFAEVNLSKCAGTTPFDNVYAPARDMFHVTIDGYIANAFRTEVYTKRDKSYCSGDCPDYVIIAAPPTTPEYQAAKSITMSPDFVVNQGVTFKAEVGCVNNVSSSKDIKPLPIPVLAICPFEFDQAKNEINCFPTYTNFKVFVKNLTFGDYAEFSTDGGTTWFRANIGDTGYSINLPNNPGQVQAFDVRPHFNSINSIFGFLQYCS
jgi:hypothetical protein